MSHRFATQIAKIRSPAADCCSIIAYSEKKTKDWLRSLRDIAGLIAQLLCFLICSWRYLFWLPASGRLSVRCSLLITNQEINSPTPDGGLMNSSLSLKYYKPINAVVTLEHARSGHWPLSADRDHQLGTRTVESQQKMFDWSIIFFAFPPLFFFFISRSKWAPFECERGNLENSWWTFYFIFVLFYLINSLCVCVCVCVCCGGVTQSENVYYFLIGPLLDILFLVSHFQDFLLDVFHDLFIYFFSSSFFFILSFKKNTPRNSQDSPRFFRDSLEVWLLSLTIQCNDDFSLEISDWRIKKMTITIISPSSLSFFLPWKIKGKRKRIRKYFPSPSLPPPHPPTLECWSCAISSWLWSRAFCTSHLL